MSNKKLNKEEFDKIVSKKKVVLVDMFATWCGPCQMMAPIIKDIEKEYEKKDEVEILTVDIDENPDISSEYSVMSVPTFVFFKYGKMVDSVVGATAKDILLSKIEELLK
jgi:thioredoxin 1